MADAGTVYADIEARTDNLRQEILDALASIDGTVTAEADATAVTSEIEDAISAVDGTAVEVDALADTDTAQAEIDAIEGGSTEVAVTANTEQAQASIDDLGGSIGSMADAAGIGGGAVGGLTGELSGLLGASTAATAGLAAVAGGLAFSVDAAMEAQVVGAETQSMLDSLGVSAVTSADHIAEMSQRIMEYSGFSDEAVQSAGNTLLMFDQIDDEATFDRALESSADLARRMGTDVPQAARMLGMAMQDPESGMNRLRRAGVVLSDAQKDQISSFMAVGDAAAAQAVILDALEAKIGNVAEDYGQTLPGQIDILKEEIGNLAEEIGGSLLPALEGIVDFTSVSVDQFRWWDEQLGGMLTGGGPLDDMDGKIAEITGEFEANGTVAREVIDALAPLTAEQEAFADAADRSADEISGLNSVLSAYLDGSFALPQAQRELRQSFDDLFGVLATEGHTADDVAAALEGIAYSTAGVGAASGDFAGIADLTIARLRDMRDTGKISAEMFDTIRDSIRGAQAEAPLTVPTSTPGATQARNQVDDLNFELASLPTSKRTSVHVDVYRAGFDALLTDLTRLDAADTYRAAVQVSVNDESAPIVPAGRSRIVDNRPSGLVPAGALVPAPAGPAPARPVHIEFKGPVIGTSAPDLARYLRDAMAVELRDLDRSR